MASISVLGQIHGLEDIKWRASVTRRLLDSTQEELNSSCTFCRSIGLAGANTAVVTSGPNDVSCGFYRDFQATIKVVLHKGHKLFPIFQWQ